jgi:hypothetical protein
MLKLIKSSKGKGGYMTIGRTKEEITEKGNKSRKEIQ